MAKPSDEYRAGKGDVTGSDTGRVGAASSDSNAVRRTMDAREKSDASVATPANAAADPAEGAMLAANENVESGEPAESESNDATVSVLGSTNGLPADELALSDAINALDAATISA